MPEGPITLCSERVKGEGILTPNCVTLKFVSKPQMDVMLFYNT